MQSLCYFERQFGYILRDVCSEHVKALFWYSFWDCFALMNNAVRGIHKMNTSTTRFNYARVSTADQYLEAQITALEAAGCTMIRIVTNRRWLHTREPPLTRNHLGSYPSKRNTGGHVHRPPSTVAAGSSGHCRKEQGKGRPSRRHRTARGHFIRCWQDVFRHAESLYRVRNQTSPRTLGRRNRHGQMTGRL